MTIELEVGPPAAGGSCVAHHDNATFFVRGALPGERVVVQETGRKRGGRIRFARVTEVLRPSRHRVVPPCSLAQVCGGCDLQHVERTFQAQWKALVLRDQLRRIGGVESIAGVPLDDAVEVKVIPPVDGLGWRTRAAIDVDAQGRACFHAPASHTLVPVGQCPVVVDELQATFAARWTPGERIYVQAGEQAVVEGQARQEELPTGWRQRGWVMRHARGRNWRVATEGFWQSHREAPDLLAAEVANTVTLMPGEHAADLYSGVGLFAAELARLVGSDGRVHAVEGDERASRLARRNLHDLPQVRIHRDEIGAWLRTADVQVAATVIDPPRRGAGESVIAEVARRTSRAIVHVGCDGASLARDLRSYVGHGWAIETIRAFDLFPMTSHIEAVAVLKPVGRVQASRPR